MRAKRSDESDDMWFHRLAGSIILVAHTKKSPDAAIWTAMCACMSELLDEAGAIRTCVFTDGGGPSSSQRTEIQRVATGSEHRISVVSSAAAVRFIASSFTLFNPTIKIFAPDEWRGGLAHLSASAAEIEKIQLTLKELVDRPRGSRFATVGRAIKGSEGR